jgi:hypothetical protein
MFLSFCLPFSHQCLPKNREFEVDNDACKIFAVRFYDGLFRGWSVSTAFKTAISEIAIHFPKEIHKFLLLPEGANHDACLTLPPIGEMIDMSNTLSTGNLKRNRFFENGCAVTTELYRSLHKSAPAVIVVAGESGVGKSEVISLFPFFQECYFHVPPLPLHVFI